MYSPTETPRAIVREARDPWTCSLITIPAKTTHAAEREICAGAIQKQETPGGPLEYFLANTESGLCDFRECRVLHPGSQKKGRGHRHGQRCIARQETSASPRYPPRHSDGTGEDPEQIGKRYERIRERSHQGSSELNPLRLKTLADPLYRLLFVDQEPGSSSLHCYVEGISSMSQP